MVDMSTKILDGIMGLAVGDAFGVPYEFVERERVKKILCREMVGAGTHGQKAGTWSDDTSLTLCLLDNLDKNPNYYKIMYSFTLWYEKGAYTANGNCFDIGITTRRAIKRYESGIYPLACGSKEFLSNGNGSLMRILPMVFYIAKYKGFQLNIESFDIIHKISALTHAHPLSFVACDIYVNFGILLLHGYTISDAYEEVTEKIMQYIDIQDSYSEWLKEFEIISNLRKYKEEDIKSSGYVVDSLIAAIWSLLNSGSYEECIFTSVGLGNDTDTIAAIAGGLAGIYYGYETIPTDWIQNLQNKEFIMAVCHKWNNK